VPDEAGEPPGLAARAVGQIPAGVRVAGGAGRGAASDRLGHPEAPGGDEAGDAGGRGRADAGGGDADLKGDGDRGLPAGQDSKVEGCIILSRSQKSEGTSTPAI